MIFRAGRSAADVALHDFWRAQRSWVFSQQLRLARVAAPTGQEQARASLLTTLLCEAGASPDSIVRDDVGNVSLCLSPVERGTGSAPSLVCMAHLDTVFAADTVLDPVTDGPIVRCPGIGDNGRGLAALLVLAHTLHRPEVAARLTRPVHLVATVGEEGEGNLRGARAWFDAQPACGHVPGMAIAIDGPGDSCIVHHGVGSTRLRVVMRGHGGHSWIQAGAPNPIHALGAFITRACALSDPVSRALVVTVTRMHGGEALTSVPQEAWVDLDVRSTDATRLAQARRTLVQLAHTAASDAGATAGATAGSTARPLDVHIVALGDRPAGSLDAGHPLVRAAVHATEAVGCTPQSAMASTDANVPLARGIPAIALGAGGRGGGAHTLDEWYDDSTGAVGMERLVRLVLSLVA